MTRAGKSKQATQRARNEPKTSTSQLADWADDTDPVYEIEALDIRGGSRSWRWRAEHAGKPEGGNTPSATRPAPRQRRTRPTLRPQPPKGRGLR